MDAETLLYIPVGTTFDGWREMIEERRGIVTTRNSRRGCRPRVIRKTPREGVEYHSIVMCSLWSRSRKLKERAQVKEKPQAPRTSSPQPRETPGRP